MTDPTGSIVASQITVSGIVIFLMEVGKKVPWLPITKDSAKLNRWVAVIASGLVAAGIHMSYTWNPATRVWGLGGTLPTMSMVLWGLGHWARSYLFQEFGYQIYSKGSKISNALEALEKMEPPPQKTSEVK